ncbi:MAG: anaerobic carbon-monoxide dehydrogenase catalytic subunit [Candidatus Parvarchaeota archaeon]|nr:anaerobic carbon-monoxide dehydrogenase catalytic subunit [Candidatus Jingweiarchaeum tengchongense]MCW1299897.1 anaerobic carbon-monoxide dehydrogenase catalytic subunit [Candidatus Jingweiarchaeum tengchongense]MCW1305161.1 anaerobic carbon-monoxide dehydrogenase catalytic subunit [Candidatus Jingweiarchaeum tengchongense]MCW1310731.1 anaerobic carbon-monoxide dehydrogenase catalytic subunit [Candidatus Jingweiarchaeum tengchongense]
MKLKIEEIYKKQKSKEREFREKWDKRIIGVRERAKKLGADTILERAERSSKVTCELGEIGVCCRLCNMGPCTVRTSAFSSLSNNETLDWKGICGANADLIIAKNMLRAVAAGASFNLKHALYLSQVLRNISRGQSSFTIVDHKKLIEVSDVLKIKKSEILAEKIAEISINDLLGDLNQMNFLTYLNEITLNKLKKNQILPRSCAIEINEALQSTVLGSGDDLKKLFLQTLRTSIATGFCMLISNEIQDIIFGVPKPKLSFVDLGTIRKDKVNIVVSGTLPLLAEKILLHTVDDDLIELAISEGANGIGVYGMADTGKEMLSREGTKFLGDFESQELAILTGAIDLFVVDFGCTIENIEKIASSLHTKVITTMDETKIQDSRFIKFDDKKADDIAREIIKLAIENFKNRYGVLIPENKNKIVTGFSFESITEKFGSVLPLINVIREGKIKGIVIIFGCRNPKKGHDLNAELARELIKHDVLVMTAGCTSFEIAKEGLMREEAAEISSKNLKIVCEALKIPPVLDFGSCMSIARIFILIDKIARTLNTDISLIPIVFVTEYINERTMPIVFFMSSLGLTTIIETMPPIFGSERYLEFCTKEIEELTGGKIIFENDPSTILEIIKSQMKMKRLI